MSDPAERDDDDAVDRLVRAHLDREAERIDTAALLDRLRDRPPMPASPGASPSRAVHRPGGPWSRPVGWLAVAAAALVGAFLGGRALGPSPANAAAILRAVRVTHAKGVDRCYRVHFAPDPRSWDGSNVLGGPSESVLWTRGDRFWADCTIGPIRLKIGRSEDGTLWLSPSPEKGIRFQDGESQLPDEVAVLCDLNSLTVPALVDDVLADFDLRAEGPRRHDPDATSLVWARLKPGRSHPVIASALLEIDARGDTLRRLVVWLVRDGQPRGTVTYTLIDSGSQGDDRYRLQSHLEPGAEIETNRLGPAEAADPGREEGEQ